MAEANNPYVVNLLEYNEEDGIPYLVLEFVAGESLDRLLAERTRLDETRGAGDHGGGGARLDGRPTSAGSSTATSSRATSCCSSRCRLGRRPDRPRRSSSTVRAGPGVAARAPRTRRRLPSTVATVGAGRAAGQDLRLRAGPARRRYRIAGPDRGRRPAGNAPLHGAGAMDGPCRRSADGRLCDGRHAVPPAGRPAAVRRRETRDELCAQHCNEPPPPLATLNPAVSEGVVRVVERAMCQAARGSLRRCRGDAPRPGGPAPRQADRHRRCTRGCPTATRSGSCSSSSDGSWNRRRGSSGRS